MSDQMCRSGIPSGPEDAMFGESVWRVPDRHLGDTATFEDARTFGDTYAFVIRRVGHPSR